MYRRKDVFLLPHFPLGTGLPQRSATQTAFFKLIFFSIPGGMFLQRHGTSTFLISAQQVLEGLICGPLIFTYLPHSFTSFERFAPQICACAGEIRRNAATMAKTNRDKGSLRAAIFADSRTPTSNHVLWIAESNRVGETLQHSGGVVGGDFAGYEYPNLPKNKEHTLIA